MTTKPAAAPASAPSAAPRRRWLRRIVIGVVLIIVLVALLAALAPTLVSSGPGTRLALSIANGYIPGTISADLLSVGWFSGARIDGLKITQPDGKVVINAGVSAPDFSLSRATGGATDFGVITVTNPSINYEQYSDGTNSITRALIKVAQAAAPAKTTPTGQTNTNYRAKLVLTGGTVLFVMPGQAPVTVENLNVNAQVATLSSLTADLKASVKQGENSGQIELKKCSVTDLFDSAGNLQYDRTTFDIDAQLSNLPIAMADAIASTSGNLVALLGDKADAEFTANGSLASLTGHAKVTTAKLTSVADVTATKTEVTAGASVHLAVDPETWKKLTATGSSGAPLLPAITRPAVLDLTLEKTTQPIENNRIDLAAILKKITIKPIELAFENSAGAPIAPATFAKTANQITLTIPPALAGLVAHQQTAGNADLAKLGLAEPLTVSAEVQELFLTTGTASGYTFKATVSSPKIAAIGLPQLNAVTVTGLAAELSGESAGGKTKASANLGLKEIAFQTDQRLATTRLSNLKLSVPSVATSGELKASFSTDIMHGEEKGTLTADVGMTPGENMTFSASTTAVNLPLDLADILANQKGKLVAVAGPKVETFTASAASDQSGKGAIHFSLDAKTAHVAAKLSGRVAPQDRIEMYGSSVALSLTPQSFDALMSVSPSAQPVSLQQDFQATVTIAEIIVPWPKSAPTEQPATFTLDPSFTKADLTIALPQAAFKLAETGDVVTLKDFSAHLATTNPAKETTAVITAQFNSAGAAGAIDSHTTITNLVDAQGHLQLASAGVDTDTKLKEVPLRLIDALAGLGGKLVRSLGPTMNQLNLTAKSAGRDQPINFTVAAQSQFLDANLSGAFTPGKEIVVTKGSAATLTITDDTLSIMQSSSVPADRKLALQKPAKYRLTIADAALGWPENKKTSVTGSAEPMRIDPSHTKFNIELTGEPTAILLRDSGELATFSNLKFSAQTDNPTADTLVNAHFDVQIGKAGETPASGKFDSKTTLKNLASAEGLIQMSKASIASETSLENVPTAPLDALAATNGKLAELLGPTLAASVSANYQPGTGGPVHIKLTSANTQGDLPFTLDQNTVLHLSQDATVTSKLTPGLSKNLGLASPLLFQAVQSDKPINVFLRSNAFAMPLSPVDITKARVDGEVDLGTVTMQNGGLLKLTSLMLSQLGSTAPRGDTMPAAVTPLVFHLDKGIITTNDMWISSSLITMGTQAVSVDLNPALRPGQPFNASLAPAKILIGLSGRDLARVKELQGVFDPNYVYEIPASGPVDAIKPDYGKFVAQIAELKVKAAAQKQLKGIGGIGGALGSKILAAPQADQQAQIQKHWPNMPKAPAAAAPPAAPTAAPPPPAAPQPKKPALPKLPSLPKLPF